MSAASTANSPEIAVRSYREMYCLFSLAARQLGMPLSEKADRALRMLCNTMARLDYSLDSCLRRRTRKRTQQLVVALLLGAITAPELKLLERYWFYPDLAALCELLSPSSRRRAATLASQLFRLGEFDRSTRNLRGLVESKARQGKLAAQLTLAFIDVDAPEYSELMISAGAAGCLVDSLLDAQRDFDASEVRLPPSMSLLTLYSLRLISELKRLLFRFARRPTALIRMVWFGEQEMRAISEQARAVSPPSNSGLRQLQDDENARR